MLSDQSDLPWRWIFLLKSSKGGAVIDVDLGIFKYSNADQPSGQMALTQR